MHGWRPETCARFAADLRLLAEGRHHDPHAVLGHHGEPGRERFLAHIPAATDVVLEGAGVLPRIAGTDFFALESDVPLPLAPHWRLQWRDSHGQARAQVDPYSFAPLTGADDLWLFSGGRHQDAWRFLGAHLRHVDDVDGVLFTVWAPNAERVSVVGPFCQWDGRRYPLRSLGVSGVWELFVPGLGAGELYKFELRHRGSGQVALRADPYARAAELRPATASVVPAPPAHHWTDGDWLARRAERDWLHAPMSIYEVHLGSWRRRADGSFLSYDELADALIPYARDLGFTHLELLPIAEHPLDDSWGYQVTGQFAPTARFGSPDGLREFVDRCHAAGLGVLLDWVPGHFPRDAHGLAQFDGEPLYEYADPRKGEHRDWGTLVFDYDRREVRSFLISSACYWLEQFHFDGLRVDAVASMLYLDYGRRGLDYAPNRHGGNQNLEAIDFLRELNAATHARFPGTVVIAEESTDWPMVSRPAHDGGLGFSMKWNMGWMHDTLAYLQEDPVHRGHHHERLTFGMMYAYSENFVLPLSHDEVVHLKRSLLGRMPGDAWQRLANLRLLFAWQWCFPGKKLLFMGGEFGQPSEWDFRGALPWQLLDDAGHAGIRRLVADLNHLYRDDARLHAREFEPAGFRWLSCDDRWHSVLVFERRQHADQAGLVIALNFTPVPREAYRIGVPNRGRYREVLNTDAAHYGGSNVGNLGSLQTLDEPSMDQPWSLDLTLPPLGALILAPELPATR
ncbi:MAG: 1,4-alpha-glucan branching protein GlgB [Steroidobacteraceae bacterium]